ncbi:MAG: Hsp20/alpha crystallin family protein [Candidatus Thiodiazotropha sp. (ex Myrtea sp. 'scaly one' KF741663)]|nr:Hsp20/alpha crystallin family protein [Candidatus Thiodiazotropha sp. (ex Myrtea sp. 'scaly one' KF741663)]
MFARVSNFEDGFFDQFRRLENEMFGSGAWPQVAQVTRTRSAYPPINVGVTAEQIDVYLFAPGVDPKRLGITIHENLLTVKGERNAKQEEGVEYYRKERFDGEFHRAVNLPEDADPEKVEASYEDGVLHITIQRRESAKPRQIKVN